MDKWNLDSDDEVEFGSDPSQQSLEANPPPSKKAKVMDDIDEAILNARKGNNVNFA